MKPPPRVFTWRYLQRAHADYGRLMQGRDRRRALTQREEGWLRAVPNADLERLYGAAWVMADRHLLDAVQEEYERRRVLRRV